MNLFRKVKTITSKTGLVHFERWAIIETKWFAWYLHKIQQSDKDHMHSHPWNFISLILKGSYMEEMRKNPLSLDTQWNDKTPGTITYFSNEWFHSIAHIIRGPVWTTVFTWGKPSHGDKWTYLVPASRGAYIIPFDEYRVLRNEWKKTCHCLFSEYIHSKGYTKIIP